MKKFIFLLKQNNWFIAYILLFLIIGALSFTWFKGGQIIMGGDFVFPSKPINQFINDTFLWESFRENGLGKFGLNLPELFPYEFSLALGSLFKIPISILERLFFYFVFTLSGISMFLLGRYLAQKWQRDGCNIMGLIAGLFYMFNTYLFFKWPGRFLSLFSYIFLPLIFLYFLKGLEKKKNFKYAFVIGLLTLFLTPAAATPVYHLIIFAILFCYYVYICILNKGVIKHATLWLIKISLVVILLNLWWTLPVYYNISNTIGSDFDFAGSNKSFEATLLTNSQHTSFFNILRVMGNWALFGQWQGQPYAPFQKEFYSSLTILIISIFIPIICFGSAVLVKRYQKSARKDIFFFILLAVISLFFIKGTHEPFEKVNTWLFFNMPGFSMFRSQYEKLGAILVFSYSILFSYTVTHIYLWLSKKTVIFGKIFLSIIIALFFIVNTLPFWSGHIIAGQRGMLKSSRITIPASYYQLGDYLDSKNEGGGKLLVWPVTTDCSTALSNSWGDSSSLVLSRIFNQQTMANFPFCQVENINKYAIEKILNIAPLFNIRYLLTDSLRDKGTYSEQQLLEINIAEKEGQNLVLLKQIDNLKLYQLSERYLLPKFYIPGSLIYVNDKAFSLNNLIQFINYSKDQAFIFDDSNLFKNEVIRNKNEDIIVPLSLNYDLISQFEQEINNLQRRTYLETKNKQTLIPILNKKLNLRHELINYTIINDSYKLNIPQSGYYKVWIKNELVDRIKSIQLGNQELLKDELINDKKGNWMFFNKTFLKAESLPIRVIGQTGPIAKLNLGDVILEFTSELHNTSTAKIVSQEKISNIKYKIEVANAQQPFLFIFSENFHPDWNLYINNKDGQESLNTQTQKANGYANSWIIETERICGENKNYCVKNPDGTYNFELIVEFWPQRLFYLGFLVSGLALASFLGYFYLSSKKERLS